MIKKKIGVLGSIAIDNIFTVESIPAKGQRVFGSLIGSFVGGIGANQAMELARYTPDVYFLGQIGADDASDKIINYLSEKKVNTSRIIKHDTHTGQTYMYLISGKRDYFSIVDRGANNASTDDSLDISLWLEGLDILLLSLEINKNLAHKVIRVAKQLGLEIWLSPSPAENCTDEILEKSDCIVLNEREALMLLGISGDSISEIASSLKKYESHFKIILISLGEKGAIVKTENGIFASPAYDVEPVDYVGAGDALLGSFLAAKESGFSDYQALSFGCIAGSLTVAVEGAQTSKHDLCTLTEIYEKIYSKKDGIVL